MNVREIISRLSARVMAKMSWLPFVGGLQETSSEDHVEALRELGIGQVIATMPLWVGVVVVAWPILGVEQLQSGFREVVGNGELFIYAATTLSPILYIISRDRDVPKAFPSKYWYLCIVWIGTIVAAIVYTLQRIKLQPLSEPTLILSFWFYVASLLILYLALVFNNTYLPDASKRMKRDEQDYTQRVKDHR